MQFLKAMLVYLSMGAFLGWGILKAAHGNPWVLVAGFVGYVLALGVIGCIPKQSSH